VTASSGESSGRVVEEEVRGLTGAGEPSGTPEQRYAEYGIYDQDGQRIGPLSDLFVDENDEPEYVGVETGLPANRSVLVPAEAITVDDRLRRMVVSHPRSLVETAPSLGHEDEITPEFERRVRVHYGLDAEESAGALYTDAAEPTGVQSTDTAPDVSGHEEDDIRVRRSEEEIRVQTREREAGEVRVRKRVRTERERLSVPKKRVEVTVERAPVEGAIPAGDEAATAPQIGEEEIVVPVVEEEIVVEKRPVVKEEIRIRKEVVEEVEVVEEDVRREEVEIDDQTGRDTGSHSDAK
ncbi:MAG: YsnF/AvaK domain-containing protein, partial [Rubrobacter sp.]